MKGLPYRLRPLHGRHIPTGRQRSRESFAIQDYGVLHTPYCVGLFVAELLAKPGVVYFGLHRVHHTRPISYGIGNRAPASAQVVIQWRADTCLADEMHPLYSKHVQVLAPVSHRSISAQPPEQGVASVAVAHGFRGSARM